VSLVETTAQGRGPALVVSVVGESAEKRAEAVFALNAISDPKVEVDMMWTIDKNVRYRVVPEQGFKRPQAHLKPLVATLIQSEQLGSRIGPGCARAQTRCASVADCGRKKRLTR
jgi:hypothetical protein